MSDAKVGPSLMDSNFEYDPEKICDSDSEDYREAMLEREVSEVISVPSDVLNEEAKGAE